jgi:hypothetical protein
MAPLPGTNCSSPAEGSSAHCQGPLTQPQKRRWCGEPSGSAFLQKLMLLLTHNEHRARCVAHHVFGHATQQHMLEPGMTVRGENDQVDLLLARDMNNLTDWPTDAHMALADHALWDAIRDQRGELLLGGGAQFLLHERHIDHAKFADGIISRHDMQQDELGVELLREWYRVFECFLCALGEIHGHEHALDGKRAGAAGAAFKERFVTARQFNLDATGFLGGFDFHSGGWLVAWFFRINTINQ